MTNPTVLITGASGFVGTKLCDVLAKRGFSYRSVVRAPGKNGDIALGDISESTNWESALDNVDVVIHLAARAHVMREIAVDSLAEFRKTNVYATRQLALSAVRCGVKRLVYVSSIGVNGVRTTDRSPFTEEDIPNPHNAYAVSKWEAECALRDIAESSNLEVVTIRPPLIYGRNAPGNFSLMMNAVQAGMPLPLASIENARSLISLDNLVDALVLCVTHSSAAGNTYLISDNETISTPNLVREISNAMGMQAKLFSCPIMLLKSAGKLVGKSDMVERLVDSLEIDNGKIRRELGWTPPYTIQQGLKKMACLNETGL